MLLDYFGFLLLLLSQTEYHFLQMPQIGEKEEVY